MGGQIDVAVENSLVSLSGMVGSLAEKQAAGSIAESVRGVAKVNNELRVRGKRMPDPQLRKRIQNALAASPSLHEAGIRVNVQNGMVILLGSAETRALRNYAQEVVSNVRGVWEVRNDIEVDVGPDRSAEEIKREIEQRIAWDGTVSGDDLRVTVEGTEVELGGPVNSALERRAAVAAAWVPGVNNVDASNLQVIAPTRDDWVNWQRASTTVSNLLERTAVDPINIPFDRSDRLQRNAIRSALFYNPIVTTIPTVEVEEGVVTLSGRVDTLQQKMVAARVAGEVAGIKQVYNFIRVRPTLVPPDATVANRVRAALASDSYLPAAAIRVEADNGEVWLRGEVANTYLWGRAQEVAARVPGVALVHNRIRVPVPGAYDPPPLYLERGVLESETIYQNLQDRLFWQNFEDVQVQLDGGVVTLTGTVDTWAEKWSASRTALAAGAQEVNNLLQIAYPDGIFGS